MESIFDLNKFEKLLMDFNTILKVRITVFDLSYHILASVPKQTASLCSMISNTEQGQKRCHECDNAAFRIASRMQQPYIYHCHAGLTEVVVPLFDNKILVGYMMFGQIFDYPDFEDGLNTIQALCGNLFPDAEILRAEVRKCPSLDRQYILAAAQILKATATYAILERIAFSREESTEVKLDRWLLVHYTEHVTASRICEELNISKSHLYNLSNKLYHCGITDYVRNLRINKAKELLLCSDRPLKNIAAECGFAEYNYFISIFSKLVGISPSVYRKQHRN